MDEQFALQCTGDGSWFQPCGEAEDLSQPRMQVGAWHERDMYCEPRTARLILAWHRHVRPQGHPWESDGQTILP
jgi:hypothetical protein